MLSVGVCLLFGKCLLCSFVCYVFRVCVVFCVVCCCSGALLLPCFRFDLFLYICIYRCSVVVIC